MVLSLFLSRLKNVETLFRDALISVSRSLRIVWLHTNTHPPQSKEPLGRPDS